MFMDCERFFRAINGGACIIIERNLQQPVSSFTSGQCIFVQGLSAGVLADGSCLEQCATSQPERGSGMNFPRTDQNSEIPAHRADAIEKSGKILAGIGR
jgi:hypothetical protein